LPDYAAGAIQNEVTTDYTSLTNSTLMNNIAGLWHLDETTTGGGGASKDFADNSGQTNWGAKTGTITMGQSGKLGNSSLFDGSTGYIKLADKAVLSPGAGNFTIQAWIKTTIASGNRYIYCD